MKETVAALLLVALGVFAYNGGPLPCSIEIISDADGISEQAIGFFLSAGGGVGSPKRVRVNLRGSGQFRFQFSKNVTRIRLMSGTTVLYEGPPIASHDGPIGPLEIEMVTDREASTTRVSISDHCSIKSIWRSFT